jgi:hypothetical protein
MRLCTFTSFLLAGCLTFASGPLTAQDDKSEWGNLKATFLYDGEPPQPVRLKVDKDENVAKGPIFDRSLVVDARTKGIEYVCVWLHVEARAPLPKIHPDYAEAAKKPVAMDFLGLQLEPHIVSVRTGQPLVIGNPDPVGHNPTDITSGKNVELCRVIPAGGPFIRIMQHAEARPIPVACTIHPWESGRVIIKDHPYVGISYRDGTVLIKNLPVGKHTFSVWQECCGFVQNVKRDGKLEKWEHGRVTIDIQPGDNDLGEILCKPERK